LQRIDLIPYADVGGGAHDAPPQKSRRPKGRRLKCFVNELNYSRVAKCLMVRTIWLV